MPSNIQLTTAQVWTCTGILVTIDLLVGFLAWKTIDRDYFKKMRWLMVALSGIFFLVVWTSALVWAWDWFYSYIFPGWARIILPLVFGIFYASVAMAMHWLSLKLPGSSAVTWCILGGVEGLISHVYAIYGLGAASKPPIMQGTDPFAVLIFAIFEKAFYWSLILLGSRLIWRYVLRRAS